MLNSVLNVFEGVVYHLICAKIDNGNVFKYKLNILVSYISNLVS